MLLQNLAAGMLLSILGLVPNASAEETPVEALAPTGRLRVALLTTNPVLVSRDRGPLDINGVAPDIARKLADRLRVDFQPIRYSTVPQLLSAINVDAWDVTFLTIDPERSKLVDFTPPYLEVQNCIVVPPGSPLETTSALQASGIRIAAFEGSSNLLALSRKLSSPQFIVGKSTEGLSEIIRKRQADAFADNCPSGLALIEKVPGAHVLKNGMGVGLSGMGVKKGNTIGLKFLTGFLEQEKRNGHIAYALSRARLQGVTLAQSQ